MVEIDIFAKPIFTESQMKRIKLMEAVAKTVSEENGKEYVLKGGTGLLLAYGLPRYSTDLDFDGKDPSVDLTEIIKESTEKKGLVIDKLTVNKDTHATKRYMLH